MNINVLFDILINTINKKNYLAKIRIQEGKIFKNGLNEFKNTGFTKPSQGGKLTRELITELIEDEFLKYGEPNTSKIIEKIDDISLKIEENINAGKLDFVKSASVKSAGNYKDPMKQWSFKAVHFWNRLMPDSFIELPSSVTIVKVSIKSVKDLAPIASVDRDMFDKFREIYEEENALYNKELEDTWDYNKKGKFKPKNITLNSIAIPKSFIIPEWLRVLVDKETIIIDNLSQINPYLQFGLDFVYKTSNKEFISNLVRIG